MRQSRLVFDRPDGNTTARKHELLGPELLDGERVRHEIRASPIGDEAEPLNGEFRSGKRADITESPELITA